MKEARGVPNGEDCCELKEPRARSAIMLRLRSSRRWILRCISCILATDPDPPASEPLGVSACKGVNSLSHQLMGLDGVKPSNHTQQSPARG